MDVPLSSLELSTLDSFRSRFGVEPTALARAPGRVELLGNHTDYNGGLVMAAAIDRFTVVAGRSSPDSTACRIHAQAFADSLELPAQDTPPGSWKRYVLGVSSLFQDEPTGLYNALISGDIPIGTGLSSSASLEAAFAFLLDRLARQSDHADVRFQSDDDKMALARRLQSVENEFVGVSCGLLDQFSVIMGRADHSLFLNCATGDYDRVPLGDPAPAIVICDSRTSRQLADGMYNIRRAECERIRDYFVRRLGREGVSGSPGARRAPATLSEVPLSDLESHWDALDPVARLRARHILTENARVRRGVDALRSGDVSTLGRLMSESHASSRDDFQNSSPALDALIEAASASPGFLGGKLSGAGWAGCTVNLVDSDLADSFAESVQRGYERLTGVLPGIHICHSADGAASISLLG